MTPREGEREGRLGGNVPDAVHSVPGSKQSVGSLGLGVNIFRSPSTGAGAQLHDELETNKVLY